jgi:ATP-dependent Clp protease protease subunit
VAIAPRQDGLRTLKKQDLEKITHDTERDYFMSADEAKDYGIIDRVIEHH